MAQSESQPPEFEEDDASELKNDAASLEGSGQEEVESLQDDIDSILNSMGDGDTEWDSVDEQSFGAEGEDSEATESSKSAVQSESDDLLLRAGSILNGGETEIPDLETDEDMGSADAEGEDSESPISMPDPQTLMDSETAGEGEGAVTDPEDDADLAAMPDPLSMMSEREASPESSKSEERASGEDPLEGTPPPPPAPVALEEDEIKRELAVAEEEIAEDLDVEEATEDSAVSKDEGARPIESDAKTEQPENGEAADQNSDAETADETDLFEVDDGESFLMDDDGDDDDLGIQIEPDVSEIEPAKGASSSGESVTDKLLASVGSEESASSPSKIRRLARSLGSWPVAASIALLGAAITLASFKNEMVEWLLNGDVKGSSISHNVATIAEDVIEKLGPESPFRMAWIESDVKRVSDSEIRIYARVGVELKDDLYQPVEESVVYAKLPFEPERIAETAKMLEEIGRKDIEYPQKGWSRLYKKSASKGEVVPFNLSYRLLSSESSSDWTLSGLRIKEGDDGFAWSKGKPKSHFGKKAYDVTSREFASLFRAYERAGMAYLNRAVAAKDAHLASVDENARKLAQERQDLLMALSQGSYFKGMVIVGADGVEAREVSMVITETRNNGHLIKGVLKLEDNGMPGKHFTGFFDLVENQNEVRGHLDLTTIAFADQPVDRKISSFFSPGTVSKIKLQTDGFQMEGDAQDISLRLTRSL